MTSDSARRATGASERGTGLIGTVAGVTAFLALLTVSLHVLLHLRALSTVRAAAHDAARAAATADHPIDADDLGRAEAHGRALLGGLADRAEFRWDTSQPGVIRLRVTAPAPDLLAPVVDGILGTARLDADVVVRREQLQP